jgi:hypothetical protein
MAWYYNTETGQLQQAHGDFGWLTSGGYELTQLFGGAGWHELDIPDADTGAQAVAAAKKAFPKGATPTYGEVTPADIAAAGVIGAKTGQVATSQEASNWGSGLTQFLANLGSRSLWIRVAKVVVGVALIIVGVMRLTGAGNVVTGVAKAAI